MIATRDPLVEVDAGVGACRYQKASTEGWFHVHVTPKSDARGATVTVVSEAADAVDWRETTVAHRDSWIRRATGRDRPFGVRLRRAVASARSRAAKLNGTTSDHTSTLDASRDDVMEALNE